MSFFFREQNTKSASASESESESESARAFATTSFPSHVLVFGKNIKSISTQKISQKTRKLKPDTGDDLAMVGDGWRWLAMVGNSGHKKHQTEFSQGALVSISVQVSFGQGVSGCVCVRVCSVTPPAGSCGR